MNAFFKSILSSESTQSAKRLVTLLVAANFIVAAFVVLFLVTYLIIVVPRGLVNKDLIDLLRDILKDDVYIILSGLGFIGLENWAQIQLKKEESRSNANIITGSPSAETVNVDNITKADTVNAEQVDTVNTNTTNVKSVEPSDAK